MGAAVDYIRGECSTLLDAGRYRIRFLQTTGIVFISIVPLAKDVNVGTAKVKAAWLSGSASLPI